MKKCTFCEVDKDESEFYKNRHNKDGLQHRCKSCEQRISQIYYNKNKDDIKKHAKQMYKQTKVITSERHKKDSIINKEYKKEMAIEYQKQKGIRKYSSMVSKSIDDPKIIENAFELRGKGLFLSDISKILSDKFDKRITQISLCRLFDSNDGGKHEELLDTDYPSLEDISYIFNKKVQIEKNTTVLKHLSFNNKEIVIRRDMMIRILNKYYNKEFSFTEVKINCNDRNGDENFLGHWDYLLKYNYIEKVDDMKFKFCDRVKKWKVGFF